MTTTTFHVTGMSCSHCERAIADEVSRLSGVTAIDVSAKTGVLLVGTNAPASDDAILAAIDEAGYTAVRA